jgi:hypothetical protein
MNVAAASSSNRSSSTVQGRGVASAALPRLRVLCAAAGALGLAASCACSGSTDVVGVLDPSLTDVAAPSGNEDKADEVTVSPLTGPPLSGTGESDVLLVAGLPLPDWPGPTSPWPLDTPLRSFFSDPSDVFADSFPGSGEAWRGGAPEQAQREAFERMDVFSGSARRQMRFAASTGVSAERLRELFANVASLEDEPPSLVARDSWDDRYLVAVPAERCGRSGRRGGCSDASSDSAPSDSAPSGSGFPGGGAPGPEHRP